MDAQDIEMWRACLHPAVRDQADREIHQAVTRPSFWSDTKARLGKLVNVRGADFQIAAVPPGSESLGDQMASLRLDHDSFAAVRKDGRWYIVDTGL